MDIRNIAIIAHVDHGKTTLVDCLLQADRAPSATTSRSPSAPWTPTTWSASAASPSSPSATSVVWKGTRINIVDTPGHADFGGEVERILSHGRRRGAAGRRRRRAAAADQVRARQGAAPGPAADRADQQGRPPRRARRTRCTTRSSTCSPRSTPTTSSSTSRPLFASARQGWAATSLEAEHKDMAPLFDLIVRHVPPPHDRGRQAVPHAGDDARVRPLPRPHPDRPHRVRRDQAQHRR